MIDWRTLNISIMPRSYWRTFHIGGDGGHTYGDVVIWLGLLYVSWNWRKRHPAPEPPQED